VPRFGFIRMKVFNTISETRKHRAALASNKKSIGFVPTMGALHSGHLSLVRKAREENDQIAVSIFVNPIQFNDPKDLQKYPRCTEKDLELLEGLLTSQDFIFIPDEGEMYPEPVDKKFDFGLLEEVMEGSSREGHFNGVGVVVDRLFRIVEPERAYFGEKDFQQLAVIRKIVELENLPVSIVGCPIIRENGGLAMSSRNQLLSSMERENASVIYSSLQKVKALTAMHSVEEVRKLLTEMIESVKGFLVEYVEFADERTLQPVKTWNQTDAIRCFIAVKVGNIRLIDNMRI